MHGFPGLSFNHQNYPLNRIALLVLEQVVYVSFRLELVYIIMYINNPKRRLSIFIETLLLRLELRTWQNRGVCVK